MLSERLNGLHPYVPGEQPKDRKYIKLNANENPYLCAKKVRKALNKEIKNHPEKLGLYPDPDALELRKEIASMLNRTGGVLCRTNVNGKNCTPSSQDKIPFELKAENIFCGNGSDEVLSFVFYTFFDSSKPLVMPTFSYSFYPVYSEFYNVPMNKVELLKDWKLDINKMIEEAKKCHNGLILANPNAPTSLALSRNEIKKILDNVPSDKVVVVDEAYCDFGGESAIPLINDYKNLVVVRTFSKSFSLAGMRLGFAVSNEELIKSIFTVKDSFNHFPVDALAQTAGKTSCKADYYYAQNAKELVQTRDDFIEFLKSKGWFVLPSTTNFIFAKKDGLEGEKIYKAVKEKGILIRHFSTPGIDDFVRISVGTKKQMVSLKKVLDF